MKELEKFDISSIDIVTNDIHQNDSDSIVHDMANEEIHTFYYFNLQQRSFDIRTNQNVTDDWQLITAEQHTQLFNAINQGCIIFDDLTFSEPPPSAIHIWQDGQWHIDEQTQQQITAEQQAQAWENIKQIRYDKCRGGCYVKSVDKWFHSDDASRQQYIFMRTLPDIPQNTMWKTMDGSFIAMTKSLLDELSIALFVEEQHNFITAEQHRAKMHQAENPLDYDYSQGWSKVYET